MTSVHHSQPRPGMQLLSGTHVTQDGVQKAVGKWQQGTEALLTERGSGKVAVSASAYEDRPSWR